ncbi:pentatricopeptide repeat-containing protein at2g21090 [Phtheirospermum japonicum]|uniref:Pentatricopeptide repeat-containing protein at2g21090 n=1 Tax=Phtheirospermum japonicum TaxID=374723 RepID=A0A830C0N5_9LAMI|nr:pentatricopeptide repeat-containing protein at2g21090 [Phtheirospermum japonicum]
MRPKKLIKPPCVIQNFLNLTSRGQLRKAVDSLSLSSLKGFSVNSQIIASLIQQCADSRSIREGKRVHLHLKLTGSKHPSTLLSNNLINMYAKCGDHVKARQVFDKMSVRNLYSWNNMLAGYANLGMTKAAQRLFDKMPERDFVSWNTMVMAYVHSGWFDKALRSYIELRRLNIGYNEYSFAGILTACVKLRDLRLAKQLHSQVFVLGFLSNLVLSSSILDMYAKCGELGGARRVFDEMMKRDVLAWTTLVSGYAQWGDMKSAHEIFDKMPEKNSVSWTALIKGYAHNGMGRNSLKLFKKMILRNVEPDQFTYSSCLFACASVISPDHGMQLHSHMITAGIRPNVVVSSSLIDMYSKCGRLDVAKRVFDGIGDKQHVVLWNTMISALAHHGCGKQAIKLFTDMLRLGVRPDSVTFLVVLNACSHSGLVQEGLSLFESMRANYDTAPGQEHYACLIDLLGRSGCFDEVMNQLRKMPCDPDERVWNALLGVCKIHGNLELGRIVAKHLVEVEPRSPAAYLLLSGIYAAVGKWECAQEVREVMNASRVEKQEALSWLELDRSLQLGNKSDELHHGPQKKTDSILELLSDGR